VRYTGYTSFACETAVPHAKTGENWWKLGETGGKLVQPDETGCKTAAVSVPEFAAERLYKAGKAVLHWYP
jgi:hypothetical protein